MHSHNNFHHQRRGLSNAWLTLFVLFVSLVFLSVIYRSITNNPESEWAKARLTNLPAQLSGKTNFTPEAIYDLRGKYINLPILMYHHIGDIPKEYQNDPLRVGLTVPVKNFEEQVAWLKSAGYNSISLQNLLDFTEGKFTMPKNPVILTFDDGYEDAILNAPPVLKKHGFVGAFGVITQFSGIKYGSNSYANWTQIKQAKNIGMEIVSHTQDHFDGTNLKYEDGFVLRNLKGSRQDIKDNLGQETNVLIYPFGYYDERLVKFTKEAGFKMGIGIDDNKKVHLDELYKVPRLRVNGGTTLAGFKKMMLE